MLLIYFLIFVLILALTITFFLLSYYRKKKVPKNISRQILRELSLIKEKSYEEQVICLDKMLDYALKSLGKAGTLGDKLKNSQATFSNLDDVWYAHKLRNRIAHEISFRINKETYLKVKKVYIIAFRDIGVIIK